MIKFNWEECWKAIQNCPGYTRKICTKAENRQKKNTSEMKDNALKENNHREQLKITPNPLSR